MSKISLTFLGHSALRIRHGGADILIDPHITDNPLAAGAGMRPDQFAPGFIVVTHAHGDHLGDTVAIARRADSLVITTFELARYLQGLGCRTMGMGIGGGADVAFGRIKFTVAFHSSSTPDAIAMGNPAGVLLFIGGRTIYHAGDTALFGDMELIGRRHPIDVALLPIGDYFTMGIEDAIEAVRLLRPTITIPIHFNTYPPITVDAGAFVQGVAEAGFQAALLAPGESLELEEGEWARRG